MSPDADGFAGRGQNTDRGASVRSDTGGPPLNYPAMKTRNQPLPDGKFVKRRELPKTERIYGANDRSRWTVKCHYFLSCGQLSASAAEKGVSKLD